MKICCDCHQTKPLSEFVPKRNSHEPRCRACRAIRYNKSNPTKVARIIYERQISHSIDRGHPPPSYTLEQLVQWMSGQPDMVMLWDAYVRSGYRTELRPSVDRKDPQKPYTLDNLQLLTWQDNRIKGAREKQAGVVNANQRPVAAYNSDGTLHRAYTSIMEAVRDVNGRMWGITSVANGKPVTKSDGSTYQPKTYKGFVWKWL